MNVLKLLGANSQAGNQSLYQIISGLGLTTNLKLCLDAGDSASYDPAIQTNKWLDTSGNGFDFFRGSGTGSDTEDPTFNGSAGNLSINEYWSFDGGDYFTYDTTNETWMNNLHKNWVQVSALIIGEFPNTANPQAWFGTNGDAGSTRVGARFQINGSEVIQYAINNGSTAAQIVVNGGTLNPIGSTVIVGFNYNESTSISNVQCNGVGASETVTAITFPSASNATYTMQIGASGNAQRPLANTAKLYCIAIWEGTALTETNLTDLYNEIKGRFGL